MSTAISLPKRIAVAVDGSDPSFRAVSYGLTLAKLSNSTIVLAHVLLLQPGATRETLAALRKDMSAKGEEVLGRAAEMARSSDVPVETRIVETDHSIASAIVELANKERVDLIIVGTQGTSGYGKLMLGSTAFDTKFASRLSGSAAKYIEKKLSEFGMQIIKNRQSAIVKKTEGRLEEGELEAFERIGFEMRSALARDGD